jgi:hypothetical protein
MWRSESLQKRLSKVWYQRMRCCAPYSSSMVSYALASSQFVLKRTIGQFLLKDLDLDKLDVQLSGGQLTLFELQLNTFVCTCANVKSACETAH